MQMIDLADRMEFVVDPESEPVDLDSALARFLLGLVRQADEKKASSGSSGRGYCNAPRSTKETPSDCIQG